MARRSRVLGALVVVGVGAATAFVPPSAAADRGAAPQLDSTVHFRQQSSRRHTVIRRLEVRPAHAGSKIRVSCRGSGCAFKPRTRRVRRTVSSYSLTSLVSRARLRRRARLEVRITRPGTVGIVVYLKIRAPASPKVTILCQTPGGRRPSACVSPKRTPKPPATTTIPTATGPPTTMTTTPPTTVTTPPSARPAPPAVERLRFGIYPWGAAGCVNECAPSVAENADRSMATVKQLKGSRSFVVHLYGDYDGVSAGSVEGLMSEASWWSANGLKVAAVLRYRPADASWAAGYPAWIRTQARRLAAMAGTVSIQVGNEPNNPSPGAGDGSYPGVIEAIATAIPAARAEVVAAGRADIEIGFNWAAGDDPATTEPMWAGLRQAGGSAFMQAVGFVGVNVYPGTWSPPLSTNAPTASQIDATMRGTLDAVRNRHMPAAGVTGARIVIAETGFPTTAARTAATQDAVLRAIVAAADATKSIYGITDVYWFSLRDGNTVSGQLENGYGLLRDDYSPKPAFTTLQGLVASIGA